MESSGKHSRGERLGHEARALRGLLAAAAALLDSRRAIDLTGFDLRAGRLCAQTLDLPPDEAAGLRADLMALRTALDQIDTLLRRGRA